MFVALNADKERVHIDYADKTKSYYCPTCSSPMILKFGTERAHHYAHRQGSPCTDTWSYDSSKWKLEHLNRFDRNNQERVVNLKETKHTADLLFDNAVLELQSNRLTQKEFEERNKFFADLGLKVMWLFDVRKDFEEGNLFKNEKAEGHYRWKKVNSALKKYKKLSNDVFIFLQIDNNTIISVDWLGNNGDYGLESFYSNCSYTPEQFVRLCSSDSENLFDRQKNRQEYFKNKSKTITQVKDNKVADESANLPLPDNFDELYDELILYADFYNNDYYYGCPKNPKHMVSKKDCGFCRALRQRGEKRVCTFRFRQADYRGRKIESIFRDSEGRITKVDVTMDGKTESKFYESYPLFADDIVSIWNKRKNLEFAKFYNIKKGITAKVKKAAILNIPKYRNNLYGDFKRDGENDFTNGKIPCYECKEWVLIYSSNKKYS